MAHQIPEDGTLLPLMEEFYTIQGEGFNTGKAAYFIRLGGCDVGCHWCDVKESWDAELHALTSADQIIENASMHPAKAVVVTGGEPLIYNLDYLNDVVKEFGIRIKDGSASTSDAIATLFAPDDIENFIARLQG